VQTGGVRGACEAGSRWKAYALTEADRGSRLEVTQDMVLMVDGQPRTQLTQNLTLDDADVGNGPWTICRIIEGLGEEVRIGVDCESHINNPVVRFDGSGPAGRVAMTNPIMKPVNLPAKDSYILHEAPAQGTCSGMGFGPVFAHTTSSSSNTPEWLMLDRRLRLMGNAVEAPASGPQGVDSVCPRVPKTFLNAHTCVPAQSSCSRPLYGAKAIVLNNATARSFLEEGDRYVYLVSGLRLEDRSHPCAETITRWLRVQDDPCTGAAVVGSTDIDATTHAWLAGLLEEADDGADVVDIPSRDRSSCTLAEKGIRISVQDNSTGTPVDRCWEHVHPNELSYFDMSFWSRHHDGNRDAWSGQRPNPITAPALRGSTEMAFPSWHTMGRWEAGAHSMQEVGRKG